MNQRDKKLLINLQVRILKFVEADHQQEDCSTVQNQAIALQKEAKTKNVHPIYEAVLSTACMKVCAQHHDWKNMAIHADAAFNLMNEKLGDQTGSTHRDILLSHFNDTQMIALHCVVHELQKPELAQCVSLIMAGGSDQAERIKQHITAHSNQDLLSGVSTLLSEVEKIHVKLIEKVALIPQTLEFLQQSYLFYGLMNIIHTGLKSELENTMRDVNPGEETSSSTLTVKNEILAIAKKTHSHLSKNLKWKANLLEQREEMIVVILAQHFLIQYANQSDEVGLSARLYEYVKLLFKKKYDYETFLLITKYNINILNGIETTRAHIYRDFNFDIHQKLNQFIMTDDRAKRDVDVHLAYIWTGTFRLFFDQLHIMNEFRQVIVERRNQESTEQNKRIELTKQEMSELYAHDRVLSSPHRFYDFVNNMSSSLLFLDVDAHHSLPINQTLYFPFPELSKKLEDFLGTFPQLKTVESPAIRAEISVLKTTMKLVKRVIKCFFMSFNHNNLNDCIEMFSSIINSPEVKGIYELHGSRVSLPKYLAEKVHDLDAFLELINVEMIFNFLMKNGKEINFSMLHKWQESLVIVSDCYNAFSNILNCFSKYPFHFYNGKTEAKSQQEIIEKIIQPELIRVSQSKADSMFDQSDKNNFFALKDSWSGVIGTRLIQEQEAEHVKKMGMIAKKIENMKKLTPPAKETSPSFPENKHEEKLDDEEDQPEMENEGATEILSEAVALVKKSYYYTALSKYQQLADFPQFCSEACYGILLCQINLLTEQLQACIQVFIKIKKDPYEISPEQAKACYDEVAELKNGHQKFLDQYDDALIKKYKSQIPTGTSTEQTKRAHDMQSGLVELSKHKSRLIDVWMQCEQEEKNLKESFKISKFYRIMDFGLHAKKITDEKICARLKEIGSEHYLFNEHKNNRSSDFLTYKKVFDAGSIIFIQRGEENTKKYGKSKIGQHRQLLNHYKDAFKPVEYAVATSSADFSASSVTIPNHSAVIQENAVPTTTAAPVAIITSTATSTHAAQRTIKPDDLLGILSKKKLFSVEDQKMVQQWIQNDLSLILFDGTGTHLFSSTMAYEFLCSQLISPNLEKNYIALDQMGLLNLLIPIAPEFHQMRRTHHEKITSALKLIGEKINQTSLVDFKNDLIFARIFMVILSESLPETLLRNNLSSWQDKSLPIYRLCFQLNLSATCQNALFLYLTGKLALEQQSSANTTTVYSEDIDLLCNKALPHIRRLLDETNIQDVPFDDQAILDDPQLFLNTLSFAVQYGFHISATATKKIHLSIEAQLTAARSHKEHFLPALFAPSRLQSFFLTHLTTGNAAACIQQAAHYNLLGLMFAIPIQAQPLSKKTLKNLEKELKDMDANVEKNRYDQVAKVVLSVLYHSCLSLENREHVFREACQHSIQKLYIASEPELRLRIQFGFTGYYKKLNPSLSYMSSSASVLFAPNDSVEPIPGLQNPILPPGY